MGNINTGRVILGGLLAGLVINVVEYVTHGVVLAQDWAEAMKALNKQNEMTGGQIAALNGWGFLMGIFAVWLYAAIRPRYGAGPNTAVRTGLAVWFVGYLMAGAFPVIFDLYPMRLMVIGSVVGVVEAIVATLLGAMVYKEETAPATAGAAAGGR